MRRIVTFTLGLAFIGCGGGGGDGKLPAPGWKPSDINSGNTTPSNTNTGGSLSAQVLNKLHSCGLVGDGRFTLQEPTTDADRCTGQCMLSKASCTDWNALLCGDDEAYALVESCYSSCRGAPMTCEDGKGELYQDELCDGHEDCEDGSDERSCPDSAFFVCGDGEKMPASLHCDGEADCDDSSDEDGCPAGEFDCGDGEHVPAGYVCDGDPNCEDGSDEAQGCAPLHVMCGA